MFVLSVGCDGPTGGATADGPLEDTEGEGLEACLPRRQDQSATFGLLEVPNQTDGPLTLTGISFAETEGVTVLGAVVSPPDDRLYATGFGWPESEVPEAVWNELTRPLEHAEIAVNETELVLVGLRLDEASGVARRLLLDYKAEGEPYRVEIDHTYRLTSTC